MARTRKGAVRPRSVLRAADVWGATHDVVVGGGAEESAEGDDRGEAREVHEEDGGDALDVEGVAHVRPEERHLAPDVADQAAEQPDDTRRGGGGWSQSLEDPERQNAT